MGLSLCHQYYYPPRQHRDDCRLERRSRRDDHSRGEDPSRENERRSDREVINTIARGFASGRSSNSVKKKHLRAVHQVNMVSFLPRIPTITFIDDDFKGVDLVDQE